MLKLLNIILLKSKKMMMIVVTGYVIPVVGFLAVLFSYALYILFFLFSLTCIKNSEIKNNNMSIEQ